MIDKATGKERQVPIINTSRIMAIIGVQSITQKHDIQTARKGNRLIDLTKGLKMKAVLYLDTGQIIVSPESVGCFTKFFPNQKGVQQSSKYKKK